MHCDHPRHFVVCDPASLLVRGVCDRCAATTLAQVRAKHGKAPLFEQVFVS